MIIDRGNNNRQNFSKIEGIKVVHNFVYLGSLISDQGSSEKEIRKRVAISPKSQ